MAEGSAQREWVWKGRLWPTALGFFGIAVVFGAAFYFIDESAPPRSGAASLTGRWAALVVFGFVALYFSLLLGFLPRRVIVSDGGIVVQRWMFGTARLSREEITGVRTPRKNSRLQSSQLWVRRKSGGLWAVGGLDNLNPSTPSVIEVAYTIFGPTEEQRAWDAAVAAAASSAGEHSSHRFEFKGTQPWEHAMDVVCALVLVIGAVFYRPIIDWAVNGTDGLLAVAVVMTFAGAGCLFLVSGVGEATIMLRGGRIQSIEVAEKGVTVRSSRKVAEIARERIAGISSYTTNACKDRRVRVHLTKRGFYQFGLKHMKAEPAQVVGALYARFGEYQESRPPPATRVEEPPQSPPPNPV